MLIEVHMLKNYAPSNLNRDDTGTPKTCMFGGVQRGRISSQCLKRSWRISKLFQNAVGKENFGFRTRKLPELIAEGLEKKGYDQDLAEEAAKLATKLGKKEKEKKSKGKQDNDDDKFITGQIVFYSQDDINSMVDLFDQQMQNCTTEKDISKITLNQIMSGMKKRKNPGITLDMALFGRMVTDDALCNVEASMQVAHAISTNRVMLESDYFTAVDDLIKGGSAYIQDADFDSSCYYIYASIDTDKLEENLKKNMVCDQAKELVQKTIPALIQTMAFTNPSGKQNTFASHVLPSAILVECRDQHIPVSLANAFEKPVRADHNGGLIYHSIEQLINESEKLQKCYGIPYIKKIWFTTEDGLDFNDTNVEKCSNFNEMLDDVAQVIGA
ncbi:MAG: type I-E CRISPR-associated protein Cas7/Cse4/CasC [Pseudoramibacter sp.]|jgi:CRISPR system Cascade subunit CasC